MLGCKPPGRLTEQHDIFFGIASSLKDLVPQMQAFWPEAHGIVHLDAWREITRVDGYAITVVPKNNRSREKMLYFINLGGYKPGEFEEFHYKLLTVAPNLSDAVKRSKTTAFYKHYGFENAVSHVDDKYGIDVDDAYNVLDVLETAVSQFSIEILPASDTLEDTFHIGYLTLSKLLQDGKK